jgi:hypothetical protein
VAGRRRGEEASGWPNKRSLTKTTTSGRAGEGEGKGGERVKALNGPRVSWARDSSKEGGLEEEKPAGGEDTGHQQQHPERTACHCQQCANSGTWGRRSPPAGIRGGTPGTIDSAPNQALRSRLASTHDPLEAPLPIPPFLPFLLVSSSSLTHILGPLQPQSSASKFVANAGHKQIIGTARGGRCSK